MNPRTSLKKRILSAIKRLLTIRAFERVILLFSKNIEYGKFLTKLVPEPHYYRKGSIREVTRHGINYRLDISDMVDWYIYFGFKQSAHLQLYKCIKPNHVIIDVGANIGLVSLKSSKLTSASGAVHSFEPDPINFERLTKNIELNNFSNITSNRLGLGDINGAFELETIDENNLGMHRIALQGAKQNSTQITVITLDEYLDNNTLERVDIIKIDVEGFEMKVLNGAKKCLNKYHPILFIELDDLFLQAQGDSAEILITFIEEQGYTITRCDTEEQITSKMNFTNCHFDILCIHNN